MHAGMKSLINAGVVGLLLAVVLVWASPASAHNVLRSSTPADGAVVATPPSDVHLVFDQSVVTLGTEIAVTGPAGPVPLEPPVVDGETVTQPLPDGLPAGAYTVDWRATSADGHPVSGSIGFTAEAAAPTPTEAPTTTASPTSEPTTSPSPTTTDQVSTPTEDDEGLPLGAWLAIGGGVLVAAGAGLWSRRRP